MSEGPRVEGDLIATSHIRDIINIFSRIESSIIQLKLSHLISITLCLLFQPAGSWSPRACSWTVTRGWPWRRCPSSPGSPWSCPRPSSSPPPESIPRTKTSDDATCNPSSIQLPSPNQKIAHYSTTTLDIFLLISIAQKFLPKWSEAAFLTMSHLLCIF